MQPIIIRRGKTFKRILRWGTLPFVYAPIAGITQAAPAVVNCPAHGMVDGWRAAIVSVKGMLEINAKENPPGASDFQKVTLIDANSVSFNAINASNFKPWLSGGYLQYYTPVDLTGYSARGSIKDRIGGTILLSLTDANFRIAIDNALRTITLLLSAADTEVDWRNGIFDLEMVSADVVPVVTGIINPTPVVVKDEVTTT